MFVSRALRVFITLYQEKSLKSAADKLCLTVPPVSRMLRLTEVWLGESLFVIERNNVIPTPTADSIYQRLLPHYCILDNIVRQGPELKDFRLSSPHINTSILSNLLSVYKDMLPPNVSVRYAECIHPDDDIFISLQPISGLPHFEMVRTDLVLELCSTADATEDWQIQPILVEREIRQLPHFLRAMMELRSRGFTGPLRQIDNITWLMSTFMKGEGLLFLNATGSGMKKQYRALPFIAHCPLYIFTNSLKKDRTHDKFLTKIKECIP